MAAIRVENGSFDTWRPGYGHAVLRVYLAGTTTLATLYEDESLTVAADNPQTLLNKDLNGVSYGRLRTPLYVGAAHFCEIDSAEQTGVVRPPITALDGEDASDSTVTAEGGSSDRTLAEHFATVIHAHNYGDISASESAATNNATIVAACAVAAALGGAEVHLPAGVLLYTSLTLAAGVVLVGRGRGVTTLRSTYAGKTVTLSGNRSGFKRLTLDGASLVSSSIGVYSKAIDETVIEDAEVKRFQTGIHQRGGQRAAWRDFYIENCVTGAKLHGDNDASGGSDGDVWRYNNWSGGRVTNCTGTGVDLSYVDKKCWNNAIEDVGFEDNTGTALQINGARHTDLEGCWWSGNTTNLSVLDDTDINNVDENTIVGLSIQGGSVSGGAIALRDTLQDVCFDGVVFSDVDVTLTLPQNNVVVRNCIEDALVTVSGESKKWTRCRAMLDDSPSSFVVTSNNTATVVWEYEMAPGEVAHFDAVVIANAKNTEDRSVFHIAQSAARDGSELSYDAQTGNFTLGNTLTGGTSGATAIIVADADGGATGTLTLRSINGAFVDNEIITDGGTGSATANGLLVSQNAALLGSITSIEAAYESDSNTACIFTVSGTNVRVSATGVTSKTIEWTCSVKVTSSE